MNDQHSVMGQIAKMVLAFFAWLGSVELSQWNTFVSLMGGLAVIVYTVSNTYVLWKERIIRRDRKDQAEDQAGKGP